MLKTFFVGPLTLVAYWPESTSSFTMPVQVCDIVGCQ